MYVYWYLWNLLSCGTPCQRSKKVSSVFWLKYYVDSLSTLWQYQVVVANGIVMLKVNIVKV